MLDQTASFGALPVFPRIGHFVDVHRDEGLEAAKHDGVDAKGMAEAIARVLVDPVRADQLAEANLAAAHGMPISEVVEAHMRELALSWCSPVEAPRRAKFAD